MSNPLQTALAGPDGELDALLEVTSESELRALITDLLQKRPAIINQRDRLAELAANKMSAQEFSTREQSTRAAHRCYAFADAMIKLSREGNP